VGFAKARCEVLAPLLVLAHDDATIGLVIAGVGYTFLTHH